MLMIKFYFVKNIYQMLMKTMVTKHINLERCLTCNLDKITYLSEGKLICSKCGDETDILIESNKPSYKDPLVRLHIFHINELIILMNGWHNFKQKKLLIYPKKYMKK